MFKIIKKRVNIMKISKLLNHNKFKNFKIIQKIKKFLFLKITTFQEK